MMTSVMMTSVIQLLQRDRWLGQSNVDMRVQVGGGVVMVDVLAGRCIVAAVVAAPVPVAAIHRVADNLTWVGTLLACWLRVVVALGREPGISRERIRAKVNVLVARVLILQRDGS